MRIAVLSQSPELYATRRLLEAIAARGHEGVWVPVLETWVAVGGDLAQPELSRRGESLGRFQAIIPRIGTFMPELALAQLRTLSRSGVFVLNSAAAIAVSRNKVDATARLAAAGLPTVRGIFVKDLDGVGAAVDALGGAPVVVKPVFGNQGRGVLRADRWDGAVSTVQALLQLNRDLLIQPYLECGGRDERLFVVGNRVVAAIERKSAPGDFRSNVHQGGEARAHTVDAAVADLALRAVRALDLDSAGVDVIRPHEPAGSVAGQPVVLEVNASPGFEGLEAATGVDVAGQMIDHVQERVESNKDDGQSGPRPV